MQERDKLQNQIDTLKTTIILSNIPLPEGTEDTETSSPHSRPLPDFDMPTTVSYSNDDLDHARLHVKFPQRHEPSTQGADYTTQSYPLSSAYQGQQQYNSVLQSAPDLPNGWWSTPYHMNVSG